MIQSQCSIMLSPSKTGLLLQTSGSFEVLHASSYKLLASENCLFLSSDFMLSGGRAGKYSNYQVITEKKLAFFFFFSLSMKQYSLLHVEVSDVKFVTDFHCLLTAF